MTNFRQKAVSSITRLYPLYSGCGSLANSRWLKKIAGTCQEAAWCRTPGGEVLADLDDFVGRAAFYFGDLDRKITWVCKQIVRNGDTVMDIGANIGIVTVLLSDLVGDNGCVHSFEPNPELIERIDRTIKRNSLNNVVLHPIGLGAEAADLQLKIPQGNKGAASFIRDKKPLNSKTVDVHIDSLDEVILRENIKSVRLIKIDVEGFETAVFQGAKKLLKEMRPAAIIFEMNERTQPELFDEPLMILLSDNDYLFYSIPKRLLRMSLLPITRSSIEGHGHDILALAKGPSLSEIERLIKV